MTITGTTSRDVLHGGIFADRIDGLDGNDVLDGGPGADQLNGGDGDDWIVEREGGADTLDGGAGNDVLTVDRTGLVGLYVLTSVSTPVDTVHIIGGTGNDTISFAGGNFIIDAGDGDDVVRLAGAATASITLGVGRDTLVLDAFMPGQKLSPPVFVADFKTGSAASGADRLDLHTLLGRSLINWDQVSNPFTSGYVRFTSDSFGVTMNIYEGQFGSNPSNELRLNGVKLTSLTDYNLGGFTTSTTAPPATSVTGTNADESFYGTAGSDTIDGGDGRDHIEGGFGADTLSGGEGDDYLNGQTGSDTLYGGGGNDTLEDNAGGADMLNGEGGDDVINASRSFNMPATTLTLNGGAGDDIISYSWIFDGSETSFPTKVFTTNVDAGDDNDVVRIGAVRGSVQVTLGAGSDTVAVDSRFVLGKGTIAVADFAAGDGGDVVDLSSFLTGTLTNWNQADNPFATGHLRLVQVSPTQLTIDVDANGGGNSFVTMFTLANVDAASLTAFNLGGWDPAGAAATGIALDGTEAGDTLTGTSGADTLNGLGGDDVIGGGLGNDTIDGGEGNDQLSGGGGGDRLDGGAGDDWIEDRDGGADMLTGGLDNDHIVLVRTATAAAAAVQGLGGDGDDTFTLNIANATALTLDGGDGNDAFDFRLLKGSATLTLGAGQDTILLERDYFGPYNNQAIVNPITVTDFETGANGDVVRIQDALTFGAMWATDNHFRNGTARLAQSGSDVLLQYTYSPSQGATYQTLFRFENHLVSDFTAANFDEAIPITLVAADGATVGNAAAIFGLPGARIAGAGATFVNQAGGRIDAAAATQPGDVSAAVQFTGTAGTFVNEAGATIAGLRAINDLYSVSSIAILGSANDDTVANAGTIIGTVSLGGGNDHYLQTVSAASGDPAYTAIDLGDGDDVADFDLAGSSAMPSSTLAGGTGTDTLIIRNITGALRTSWQATGFETLRLLPSAPGAAITITSRPNVADAYLAPGLTLIVPDRSSGRPYTVAPAGILHLDGGSFSTGLAASFAQIVGSDEAETVTLANSRAPDSGFTPLGLASVALAGGDDRFEWGYGHARPGSVDGGTGDDWLKVSQFSTTIDLSPFTHFETVEIGFGGNYAANFVQTLSGIGADAQRLLLGTAATALTVQLDVAAPDLAVGAGASKLVLLAGTTVGSISDRALIDPGQAAAQAQSIENRGHVSGGVDLGGGNDAFVNSGLVGGDVALGGGDDSFTNLAGSSVGGAILGGSGNDVYVIGTVGDVVIENAGEGTDEVRTALSGYVIPDNVENLTGTGAGFQTLRGNAGNNVVAAGAGGAFIDLSAGGTDIGTGSGSADIFYFGAGLDRTDQANGAGGQDSAVLQGDYSGGVLLGDQALDAIETLSILSHSDNRFGGDGDSPFVYDITSVDANVAAGTQLVVDARGLGSGETLRFNGAAESNGSFQLLGGAGDDTLIAGAGADTLDGGAGADAMTGGAGNDVYYVDNSSDTVTEAAGQGTDEVRTMLASYTLAANVENLTGLSSSGQDLMDNSLSNVIVGGSGNDKIFDETGATGTLIGNDGDDYLFFRRYFGASWTSAAIEGGNGNDQVLFGTYSAGAATVDLGAGDDKIYFEKLTGTMLLTLGAGCDMVDVGPLMDPQSGSVVVTDFQAGAGGDWLFWNSAALSFYFGGHGYAQGSNPFAQGYARLVQSGADTLLQVSDNADGNFRTVLTFQNHVTTDFTADNLGWSPTPTQVTGASPSGTSGDDWLVGSNAAAFFNLSQGGNDFAKGGSAVDAFYFGGALTAADGVDGGAGKDIVALQGDYSDGVTLGANSLVNIETLSILSHSDNRFGGGGASPFSYDITSVDANVAAGQQLIVNASTLEAGENFTFNGSAEADGGFFIYGGKGDDQLTGGSGLDVFFFAEDGRFGASDSVNGGAGSDILVLRGNYTIDMGTSAVTNVETVTLMSGSDARFFSTTSNFSYDIKTAETTVAPGVTMTFNGGGLHLGETLHFDGSAESDGGIYRVFGGADADVITGGSGNDLILGGLGADTLSGGGGNDTFRYQAVGESTIASRDQILDFASGDTIDLSRIDAISGTGANDAFTFVTAFGGHAGELMANNGGSGNVWTVSGDVDGDGLTDFQILVTVADGHAITASDFLL